MFNFITNIILSISAFVNQALSSLGHFFLILWDIAYKVIVIGAPIIGLITMIYTLTVALVVLIPQQWSETVGREHDEFTKIRWKLLRALFGIVVALSPVMFYRFLRVLGGDNEFWRAVSSLCVSWGIYLLISALHAIFTYKYKK